MDDSPQATKFQMYQNIYFKISLSLLTLGLIMFGLGMIFANQVEASPPVFILLTVFLQYYHFVHVTYGVGSLIYFFIKIHNKIQNIKIVKTIVSIVLSPISYFLFYVASILLFMTQCASD